MRHFLAGWTLLAAAVFAMSGCSSGVGPVDAAACDPGIDRTSGPCADALAEACADHAAQLCAKRLECHGAWYMTAVAGDGGLEECTRKLTATCVVATALPDSLVRPAELQACADAITTCDTLYGEPECLLPGARAAGQPCLHKYQCQSGACSGVPSTASTIDWLCGKCAAAEGAACEKATDCGAGLTCSAMSQTCVPRSKAGEPCKLDGDCAGVMACIDGVCQAGPEPGAGCFKQVCNGRRGLFCTMANTCQPGTVAAAGASCAAAPGAAPVACDSSSFCNASMQCEARAAAGAMCADPGPECAYPGACDAGVCLQEIPVGEACPAGAAQCTPPSACAKGLCRVADGCK